MSKPIAIIPSRIGSRRITEKNLQKIAGKTLLDRAIDFAIENNYLPIVSTESEIVKREVEDRCPVLMSNLHGHYGNSLKIWMEAWNYMGSQGDHSILLEPTSPMRTKEDLERCVEHLRSDRSLILVRTVEEIKTTEGIKHKFNGAIYAATPKLYLLPDVYDHQGVDSVITGFRVNIDTMEDLRLARIMLN